MKMLFARQCCFFSSLVLLFGAQDASIYPEQCTLTSSLGLTWMKMQPVRCNRLYTRDIEWGFSEHTNCSYSSHKRSICAEIGSISGEKGDKAEARTEKVSTDVFERMKSAAKNKLPGQFLFENFISEEEEKQLIEYIDTCDPPWHLSTFNGPHG